MARHYYAAAHAYGIEFCNDYRTLFRFTTAAERDAFVEDARFKELGGGNIRTEAVTRDKARSKFPNAFRTLDFLDGDAGRDADERDWRDGATETSAYWNSHNIYCD